MTHDVSIRVNGDAARGDIPDRLTLADYLRDRRGLTGTKLGCEQGVCGACTVLLDGASARSCLVLAAQADEAEVVTVEGLAEASPSGAALREAFNRHDALQCGFCTPGFLIAGVELLTRQHLDEETVREALSGNLCRCTGYGGIVAAILEVHERLGAAPFTTPKAPPAPDPAPPQAPPSPSPTVHTRQNRAAAALLLAVVLAALGLLARRRHRTSPTGKGTA
jgi:carbon-monoxide dehydrogenase small subunit